MKKLYTLLSVVAMTVTAANAQTNLLTNPGFETWADGAPQQYSPYTGPTGSPSINNFLTQETTIVHGGTSSAKQQSQSATQYLEYDDLIPVDPSHTYTINYWYLDNDDYASTRLWSSWLDANFVAFSANDVPNLQANVQLTAYSTNGPDWVNKVLTVTPPAGAAYLRFQVRTYKQSNTNVGGYIYYDDFSFVDNNTAGVDNNDIAGLKMFPNPLTGNVLNITSNTNGVKEIAIYDVIGKQVFAGKTANNTVTVNNLTAGVYIVNITEEGKTATRKLVVK